MDTIRTADPIALDPETLGDDYDAWLDARIAEAIEHQDAACAADATEAA